MGDSEKVEDENHRTEPEIDTKEDSMAENESETKANASRPHKPRSGKVL